MEDHVRIATYELTQGTAEEAAELAKNGMIRSSRTSPASSATASRCSTTASSRR